MKKPCTIAAGLLLATHLTASGADNLLKNPGFEHELGAWTTTGTAAAIMRSDWHSQSSRWAFGVGNDNGPYDAYGKISQDIEISGPSLLRRSCAFAIYILPEEHYDGEFIMNLVFLDSDGDVVKELQESFSANVATKWKKKKLSADIPSGTKLIRVSCESIHMSSGEGQSFIWLDNASLKLK